MSRRNNGGVPVTVLGRKPFVPTWEAVLSLGLHGLLVLGLGLGKTCNSPPDPMINLDDVMMVHAVALPKQLGRMPDKAMRTPDPPQGRTDASAPAPPPTASDMALHKPDAPKSKGTPTRDHSKSREELMAQMRRQQLVENLRDDDAPLGSRDQPQTSPDGVDWDQAILGGGPGGIIDPVLAGFIRDCRKAIVPNWTPLPSTISSHPDYVVVIKVPVMADGSLGPVQVLKGTGNTSFDQSAKLAVVKTRKLPAPPAQYRESAAHGVHILLSAKDKQ